MKTKRLMFLDISASNAADYQRIMADPEMGRYTNVPCQPTDKQASDFVAWMLQLNESGEGKAWAVSHERTVIGFVRLNRIDKQSSIATVGFEICKNHWNEGMATEALKEVVRYCDENLELHRLEANVFGGNRASASVLEKAGFQMEGTQRSKIIHQDKRCDLWLFGRLRDHSK